MVSGFTDISSSYGPGQTVRADVSAIAKWVLDDCGLCIYECGDANGAGWLGDIIAAGGCRDVEGEYIC